MWKRLGLTAALALAAWLVGVALMIVDGGTGPTGRKGDVAVVLGAAVHGENPSPVFEQRIRHALELYRLGTVDRLLFTGGTTAGGRVAEAEVARGYALRRGVPGGAILIESRSRTTRENLLEARKLMRAHRLSSAAIVSDPLHLARALRMARDLGIDAYPAPTPTTRYRSWRAKAGFLAREMVFYTGYLVTGR